MVVEPTVYSVRIILPKTRVTVTIDIDYISTNLDNRDLYIAIFVIESH